MLPRIFVLVLFAALLNADPPSSDKLQPEAPESGEAPLTLRTQVDEVQVMFTAQDDRHHILQDLTSSDVSVIEDGHSVQRFTSFRPSFDLPLRLALVVDSSDSMQKGFAKEQQAAEAFLKRTVRPVTDSVFLVDFASHSAFSQPPPEHPELIFAKASNRNEPGLTALYDALYETSYRMRMNPPKDQTQRSAMLLLSDGDDNLSMHSLQEAIEETDRAEVAIYAITAHSRRGQHPGDSVLRQLADATGGHAFVLSSFGQADQVLAQIEQELRSQYFVSFRPATRQCGYHRILISHRNRQVRIRARDRYYQCARQ